MVSADDANHDEQEIEKLKKETHDVAVQNGIVGNAVGRVVSHSLDFLAKELVRQTELDRIQKFVEIAERTRRMREAKESGQRQQDEHARQLSDAQYTQIMATHHTTVDTFLDQITGAAVQTAAHRQAYNEVVETRERRIRENDVRYTRVQATEGDIRDLVANFLFPVVVNQTKAEKRERQDASYGKAANDALNGVLHAWK